MELPITFPSDEDVTMEEVACFRALSPENRVRAIRALLAAGALMVNRSPKAVFLREYTLEQESLGRRSIKEFIARHAAGPVAAQEEVERRGQRAERVHGRARPFGLQNGLLRLSLDAFAFAFCLFTFAFRSCPTGDPQPFPSGDTSGRIS